jgi:hypothetical protein
MAYGPESEVVAMATTIKVGTLRGLLLAVPVPKTWEGERTLDRETGRPQSTVRCVIGYDVCDVTVPGDAVDALKLAPRAEVDLVDVTIGHGRKALWVSASSVEVVK